jgi:colanic acid/amylovoran biosynthesis glycosyltransferase
VKIALAHYSGSADISGVTTWLIGFCERLVQEGHEVVIHLHHFGSDPQQGSILPSLQRLGIETHAVRRTGSLEADTRQTLQFLNRVQPDLFLPQCLHSHYLAAAHAGRQGLPWIFTMHSDDPDYWCVAEALTPETHGGSSVCVSQFLAQQLRHRLPATNPQVIPYGITLPTAQASFSDQPFHVVYSGRLVERQKCIQQVVHTLIHACRASSQIEAHLIGDGHDRSSCEQLVHQAGLADRIHFLGRVPPEQVQPLLQRSQAILLMSDFEGLPVALLEAMATGVVPVVRSIESGIPELVQHERTGLMVRNDPAEAAAALLRLSREPELWQHCSTQSRALVEAGYGADLCFERWLGVIQQHPAISRPSSPLSAVNMRQIIPFGDVRFLSQYYSSPSPWSKHHHCRIIGKLKRIVLVAFRHILKP